MPLTKSAFLRYRIIEACLTNSMRKYPKMEFIIQKIEDQTGHRISTSIFNKDIQAMKNELNAPIKYDRNQDGYCYTEEGFSLNHHEEDRSAGFFDGIAWTN